MRLGSFFCELDLEPYHSNCPLGERLNIVCCDFSVDSFTGYGMPEPKPAAAAAVLAVPKGVEAAVTSYCVGVSLRPLLLLRDA
jgi:hypothetical protein